MNTAAAQRGPKTKMNRTYCDFNIIMDRTVNLKVSIYPAVYSACEAQPPVLKKKKRKSHLKINNISLIKQMLYCSVQSP